MNRRELLDLLTVERHMPSPRPPRTSGAKVAPCDPPRRLTKSEQERNLRVLSEAIGGDLTVVEFNEGAA